MAYLIRENDFARFELIDAQTEEVIATSSHPGDLCELATCLLPEDEVSCLPQTSTERRVVEVLPGGVRRTEEPLSPLARLLLALHSR